MLVFHAFFQPYERPLYNYLDTFMFGNLAFVSGLSLYSVYSLPSSLRYETVIHVVYLSIFLPLLLIIALWVLYGLTGYSKKAHYHLRTLNKHLPLFKEKVELKDEPNIPTAETPFDEDHLPYRMFDDNVDDQEYNENPARTTVQ